MRRDLLAAFFAAMLMLMPVTGVVAADSDTSVEFGPAFEAGVTWTGFEVPDDVDVVEYGISDTPSFIVHYESGEYASLDTWASERADRSIQYNDDAGNWAVVAAPAEDVYDPGFIADSGLASLAFVEAIDINTEVSLNPVEDLQSEDDASSPARWWTAGKTWTTNGVAFSEDATTTTVANAKQYVGINSSVTATGEGVDVAILDKGIVYNQSIYGDSIVAGKDFADDRGTINVSAGDYSAIEDEDGSHGDWVASTVHEVAPNASLHIGRVLGSDGSGSTESIVRGLEWACDEQGVDIVSMSLGSPYYSQAIATEIENCADNGTLVIVAAGNSRYQQGVGPSSPADHENVLTTAATNATDPGNATSAYFSQVGPDNGYTDLSEGETRGATIDLAAPGMALVAPNGHELSGTSMATPMTTGVAALTQDATGLYGDELGDRLRETSHPMQNAASTEVGHGMVDAYAAINNVQPDEGQESVQNGDADARDAFNRALGMNSGFRVYIAKYVL